MYSVLLILFVAIINVTRWSSTLSPGHYFYRNHLRSTMGIICSWGSFAVLFGDNLRSGDHLRSEIIYCAVPYIFPWKSKMAFASDRVSFSNMCHFAWPSQKLVPVLVAISRPVAIRKKICRSLPSPMVATRSPRGGEKISRCLVTFSARKKRLCWSEGWGRGEAVVVVLKSTFWNTQFFEIGNGHH